MNQNDILDVIHKTIYQFFDICKDDEEIPMSDKDKLLLEINKAICNNIKTLEQKPKTGHWIKKEIIKNGDFSTIKTYKNVCSNCGIINASKYKNYCPNCGCRMVEPQESERV